MVSESAGRRNMSEKTSSNCCTKFSSHDMLARKTRWLQVKICASNISHVLPYPYLCSDWPSGSAAGLNYEAREQESDGRSPLARAPAGHIVLSVVGNSKTPGPSKPTTRFEPSSPFSFRQDGSRTEAAFPVWLAWRASAGHELRRRSLGSKGEIPGRCG